MKQLFTFFLFIFISSISSAQTVITGHVQDSKGKTVESFVTLSTKSSGTTESYADVDAKGLYKLEYTGEADSLVLTVSGMNIGNVTRVIANKSQVVDFTVDSKALRLKEVVVKAEKIRQAGDTLNYNVAAYRDNNDRVIVDVLKKMPGIGVSEDGSISYNGKKIKEFYVENMDLLQSRYSIATSNISAQDVATVQIMQNHQPVRSMKDLVPSSDVAINIKLRKDAKGTFALTAMVGAGGEEAGRGDRFLWQGELVGMYFGKKQQNITLYKGNNIGNDVAKEFQEKNGHELFYGSIPLSLKMMASPGIQQNRYLQNHTHVFSTNQIWKLDSLTDITLNAVYHEDRIREWGESVSDYYMNPTQRMSIRESAEAISHIHHLSASARYQANKTKNYLLDKLNLNVDWNSKDGSGTMESGGGTPLGIFQHLKCPSFTIENTFHFLHNTGKKSYTFHLAAGYTQKPYVLSVTPTSFINRSLADSLVQDYTLKNFNMKAFTGLGWKWGVFKLDYNFYTNINLQQVESELKGFENPNPSNSYRFNKYEVGVEQYTQIDLEKWFFSLNLPVALNLQNLNDRLLQTNRTWTHPFVSPKIEVRFIPSQNTWFVLNSSYYHIIDNEAQAGKGMIMYNYRMFQRRIVEEASRSKTLYSTFALYHKNTYRQFFINTNVSWLHTHSNDVTSIEYDGIQTLSRLTPFPHNEDQLGVNAEASKGFNFWRTTLKLVGSYGLTNTRTLIQSMPTDVRSRYWSTSTYLVFTPVAWLNIATAYAFGQSRSYVSSADEAQKVNNSTIRLDMNIYPTSRLILNFAVEDNYNNITAKDRHCWFGDAKVKYKTKHIDYELDAVNLFNRSVFTRVTYNGLDMFTNTSYLRPRHIAFSMRFKLL